MRDSANKPWEPPSGWEAEVFIWPEGAVQSITAPGVFTNGLKAREWVEYVCLAQITELEIPPTVLVGRVRFGIIENPKAPSVSQKLQVTSVRESYEYALHSGHTDQLRWSDQLPGGVVAPPPSV